MFALLPNHCRFRYTYQKLSHNEGDISIRVLPLSVNIFLYIYMGTACQLLDFCSTKLRYSRWLRNCIIVYWVIRVTSRHRGSVKPGLHSVRRTYATEMRKRIYASHARRGVYTPRVDLGAYTQTSTQYRLRTISGRWIYFICRVKACVYA